MRQDNPVAFSSPLLPLSLSVLSVSLGFSSLMPPQGQTLLVLLPQSHTASGPLLTLSLFLLSLLFLLTEATQPSVRWSQRHKHKHSH